MPLYGLPTNRFFWIGMLVVLVILILAALPFLFLCLILGGILELADATLRLAGQLLLSRLGSEPRGGATPDLDITLRNGDGLLTWAAGCLPPGVREVSLVTARDKFHKKAYQLESDQQTPSAVMKIASRLAWHMVLVAWQIQMDEPAEFVSRPDVIARAFLGAIAAISGAIALLTQLPAIVQGNSGTGLIAIALLLLGAGALGGWVAVVGVRRQP